MLPFLWRIILDISYLLGTTLLETIRIYLGRKSEDFFSILVEVHLIKLIIVYHLILFLLMNRCLAGSLSRHGWQVIVSALLIIPCMMGMCYLIFFQTTIIDLEKILCALELLLQTTELIYATIFTFTACRPRTYT